MVLLKLLPVFLKLESAKQFLDRFTSQIWNSKFLAVLLL